MKRSLIFSISLICISTILAGCSSQSKASKISISQGQQQNADGKNINVTPEIDYSNFKGFNMNKDDLKLQVNGKNFNFKLPIYLDKNRYYLPLNEFTDQLNGKMNLEGNLINIKIDNKAYSINIKDNIVISPDRKFKLKKSLLQENKIFYIGLSDLSNMLNLYTRWNKDTKTISCKIDGFSKSTDVSPYEGKIKKLGFLRLEDVGVSSQSYDKDYFERLRIMGNYLNERKVPYHIAWIPRFVIPSCKIDNDPLVKNNFDIAEMVFSLDFFLTHNGVIGLHGYTHQYNNTESTVGCEFGKCQPSPEICKERIEKALSTASYLDIPVDFFEAPHYEITPAQNKVAEKYFKILYYPFCDLGPRYIDLTKPQLSPYNKSSYYISSPLDYIPVDKEDIALKRIKNSSINNMGSVFYHPNLEKKFITLSQDSDGSPTFTYQANSTLKKLIDILQSKGFNITKVTDIH